MLRAVTIAGAAAVGYVLLRAAWIFVGWPGVAAVVLIAAALSLWRRPVAAGVALGAALSAVALTV